MSAIWEACQGSRHIQPIVGRLHRFVESQEQVATTQLVDSLAEQAILEELLEGSKPQQPPEYQNLHYLLKSPFRYPPLQWGSRFGRRHEPSLFYGSRELDTAMAETAYYRLLFYHGMEVPPPHGRIRTEHTSFNVAYRSMQGVRLQQPPFVEHQAELRHPGDYSASQGLGSAMRTGGVEAFEFLSARCEAGLNVALFNPAALADRRPRHLQPWLCETSAAEVSFKRPYGHPLSFPLEQFAVDGHLPQPA